MPGVHKTLQPTRGLAAFKSPWFPEKIGYYNLLGSRPRSAELPVQQEEIET